MSNTEVEEKEVESAPAVTAESIVDSVTDEIPTFEGKYYYAVGRRKSAIAQVRVYPCDSAQKTGFVVNGRSMRTFFPTIRLQAAVLKPLVTVGGHAHYAVSVLVRGGGVAGQADAVALGIARALILYKEDFRASLKVEGLLKRDPRKVERKKPGLKKARRAPQWQKR